MARWTLGWAGVVALAAMAGCCACGDDMDSEALRALREQAPLANAPAEAPAVLLSVDAHDAPAVEDDNLLFFQVAADEASAGVDAPAGEEPIGTDALKPFEPFRTRKGPAYPGEFWRNVGRDAKEWLPMMWDDTVYIAKNPWGWAGFAAAGITGITLANKPNDKVEEHFTKNSSQLNTFWDTVGDVGGNPGTHFAIAGAMYLGGLAAEDYETYGKGKMMLSALAINGLVTMGLKVAARTESPNGDEFGWPSGHTSSSFCFAATLYEAYGPWAGLPAYAFAAFVGYERIDARNHDFNDVISGALIGMTIGHLVAQNHQPRILGMDVMPWADGNGTIGLMLYKEW